MCQVPWLYRGNSHVGKLPKGAFFIFYLPSSARTITLIIKPSSISVPLSLFIVCFPFSSLSWIEVVHREVYFESDVPTAYRSGRESSALAIVFVIRQHVAISAWKGPQYHICGLLGGVWSEEYAGGAGYGCFLRRSGFATGDVFFFFLLFCCCSWCTQPAKCRSGVWVSLAMSLFTCVMISC